MREQIERARVSRESASERAERARVRESRSERGAGENERKGFWWREREEKGRE